MKCITIKQPYAGLIVAGIKTIENRTWATKYIGEIAIHSSAKPASGLVFDEYKRKLNALGVEFPEKICSINGSIIGTVRIAGLLWMGDDRVPETDTDETEYERDEQWWNKKLIGFVLRDPKIIRPVVAKGKLGIYSV